MTKKLHTDQYIFYTGGPSYGKHFVSLVLRMTQKGSDLACAGSREYALVLETTLPAQNISCSPSMVAGISFMNISPTSTTYRYRMFANQELVASESIVRFQYFVYDYNSAFNTWNLQLSCKVVMDRALFVEYRAYFEPRVGALDTYMIPTISLVGTAKLHIHEFSTSVGAPFLQQPSTPTRTNYTNLDCLAQANTPQFFVGATFEAAHLGCNAVTERRFKGRCYGLANSVPVGCYLLHPSDSTKCTRCDKGYFIDPTLKTCTACINGCVRCSSP